MSDAGNLIDGTFRYVYDAWNRLVKVQSSLDSGAATFQQAEFDGTGRRIKKVVTNSGDLNATIRYYYDGQKIIETRDGSGNLYQQFIHGTQYIDELVMIRVKDKGDLYVHQDANWNVIGLTDLGGSLVERYVYTPYGELTVYEETGYGDRDGDGDVDATDKGTVGTTCTGTVSGACRILDFDFDGDYDSTDASKFDSLPQGLARHPGRIATSVHQPFAHQGLLYEPEVGQYQNRARQYDPAKRRFVQRDPLTRGPVPAGGLPDGLNPFNYVRGAPPSQLDPEGLRVAGVFEQRSSMQVYLNVVWAGPYRSNWISAASSVNSAWKLDSADNCGEKLMRNCDVKSVRVYTGNSVLNSSTCNTVPTSLTQANTCVDQAEAVYGPRITVVWLADSITMPGCAGSGCADQLTPSRWAIVNWADYRHAETTRHEVGHTMGLGHCGSWPMCHQSHIMYGSTGVPRVAMCHGFRDIINEFLGGARYWCSSAT